MSVKREKATTVKISAKGILIAIDLEKQCFVIEDVKEGTLEAVAFDEIRQLIGKEITFNFQNKEEEV